jgi:hypothetical protein
MRTQAQRQHQPPIATPGSVNDGGHILDRRRFRYHRCALGGHAGAFGFLIHESAPGRGRASWRRLGSMAVPIRAIRRSRSERAGLHLGPVDTGTSTVGMAELCSLTGGMGCSHGWPLADTAGSFPCGREGTAFIILEFVRVLAIAAQSVVETRI